MKGFVSEEALAEYSRLAAEKLNLDFAEGEVYDFARCMRADGSFYGTSGTCKKGTAAGDKEAEAPKTAGGRKRRATAETKAAGAAERKAAGNAKRSASAGRARLLKEELEKVKDKMKGASPDEVNRLIKQASDAADKRSTQVTATPGMAARVKAAKEKLKAEKAATGGKRPDRIQEERRLAQNRAQRERDAKVKANQKKQAEMDELDRRIAAKTREQNKLAYEGMKDAERRKKETAERRDKRGEKKKSLVERLKDRIKATPRINKIIKERG